MIDIIYGSMAWGYYNTIINIHCWDMIYVGKGICVDGCGVDNLENFTSDCFVTDKSFASKFPHRGFLSRTRTGRKKTVCN